jgi:hypothetical protein
MSNFQGIFNILGKTISKHSPEILLGVGIYGLVNTVIFTAKDTSKALNKIEVKKKELNSKKLTTKETVKETWKCYIPTVVSGLATTGCFISSFAINDKRNAILTAAYALTERAFQEYTKEIIHTIGDKKEREVRDKISENKIREYPIQAQEVIKTSKGTTLCLDSTTGRYFDSDINAIKSAINELNSRLLREDWISLNELYYELELDSTSLGEYIGWTTEHGLIDVSYSSQLALDLTPCMVLSINNYIIDPYK